MASAEPEYSLEELYAEASRRGWLKDDPELQSLGHEVRRRGWIKDPTQGGLFPEKTATPAPAGAAAPAPAPAPAQPAPRPTGGVPVLPDARGLTFDNLPPVSAVAPGVSAPKAGRPKVGKATPTGKATPFTAPTIQPFTFGRLPEEDAYEQAAQALAKVPAWMRSVRPKTGEMDPKGAPPASAARPGGVGKGHLPSRAIEGRERAALAALARQLPKIDEGLAGKGAALQAQRRQLDAAVAEFNARAQREGPAKGAGAAIERSRADLKGRVDAFNREQKNLGARIAQYNAGVKQGKADPALAARLNAEQAALAARSGALQAEQKAFGAQVEDYNARVGRAKDPEGFAALERARVAYNQNLQAFNRRMGERGRYVQAIRELPKGGPLHGGPLYPQETITEGTGLGAALATTPVGRVLSGAVNFLNPAQVTTQRVREGLPAARNVLQLTGAYPALPALPKGTPEQQAEFIRQKNAILNLAYLLGDALRPDGTLDEKAYARRDATDDPMVPSRDPALARRALAGLTPWQRQLLPVIKQQLAAEKKAQEMAGIGTGVLMDAAAYLVGGAVGHVVGGRVAKKAYEKVAPFLLDPAFGAATGAGALAGRVGFASPISKAVLRELARPIPALAGGAAGGGAAGGVVGTGLGLIESKGDVGKALEAGVAGAKTGAGAGLLFGGIAAITARAVSQLKTYRTGETDAFVARMADDIGRRLNLAPEEVGALQNRLLEIAKAPSYRKTKLRDALSRDLASRNAGAPAAEAPPKAQATPKAKPSAKAKAQPQAPKPQAAEPVVRVADGPEVPVRRASGDELRIAQEQAQAAGDSVAAASIAAVVERHEKWEAANHVVGDGVSAEQFLTEWNRGDHPQRRRYNVLDTAANRTDDPSLGPILRQAADDARSAFGRERFGPGVPAENPNVSAWRRLTDDQQIAVSPPVREALLRQDIENSASVLGVDPATLLPTKGTPAELERAADEAFAQAQERAAAWVPTLEPVVSQEVPVGETQPPLTLTGETQAPAQGEVIAPPIAPPTAPIGNVGPGQRWQHEATGLVVETLPGGQARVVAAGTSGAPTGYEFDIAAGDLSREFVPMDRADAPGALPGALPGIPERPALGAGAPATGLAQPFAPSPTQGPLAALPPVAEALPAAPSPLDEARARQTELSREASRLATAAREARDAGAPDALDRAAEARKAVEEVKRQGERVKQLEREEAAPEAAPAYSGPERRKDVERRRRVEEMSPEEMRKELLTDDLTGLGNKRAYQESEKKAFQASIDADSLKWWNDTFGHPAGDALLKAIGAALKEAGADAYHISGDEFVAQGDDAAALMRLINRADDLLAQGSITVTVDGKKRTFAGMGLSYAIAKRNEEADDRPAYADADEELKNVKRAREALGLRAARGERPPGFAEVGGGEPEGRGERGVSPVEREGVPSGPEERVVAPKATGKATTFKAGDKTFEGRWAVYDIADLVTSHDDALNANPTYPADLQPRDRGRMASREQIADLAAKFDPTLMGENPLAQHGAPIVGRDAVVESGNGRTIALRTLYARKKGGAYKTWLAENAATFGIAPGDLKGVKSPVLVRQRGTPLTDAERVQFTRDANARETAAMGAAEQAAVDAERMTPEMVRMLDLGENGDITSATNRAFVRAFIGTVPTSEQGVFRTADGALSQEGMRRIKNALFLKAYGDVDALARMAESLDDPAKNITNGMLRAAGPMIDLGARVAAGTAHPVNIGPDVAKAATKYATLREQGTSFVEYMAQQSMFGDDLSPLQRGIVAQMDLAKRSGKRFAALLADYVDLATRAGDPSTGALFEEIAAPEKETLWQAAVDRTQRIENDEPGLFAEPEKPQAPAAEGREAAPALREAPKTPAGRAPAKAPRAASEEVAPSPEVMPEGEGLPTGTAPLMRQLAHLIDRGDAPKTNPELMQWFAEQGFSVQRGFVKPDFVYDVLEAAVNKVILDNTPSFSRRSHAEAMTYLRDLVAKLPTQNIRTEDKRELQQFSTPPTLSYVAVVAAAPRETDVVLEPSAGTGSLASLVVNMSPLLQRTQVHTNEIDPKRRELLRMLGFPATGGDAERIDSTLPQTIRPTLVVMNPPFSATGGRVTQHKNEFGYRHVRSALERLEEGGRLVAILGRGAALSAKGGGNFWKSVQGTGRYNVRAVIELPGDEYVKYGTTFDNVIAVVDKEPQTTAPLAAKVATLDEALELLGMVPRKAQEVTGESVSAARESGASAGERGQADGGSVAPRAGGSAPRSGGRSPGVRRERGAVPRDTERAPEPGAGGRAPRVRAPEPAPVGAEAPRGGGVRRGGGAPADVSAPGVEPAAPPAEKPARAKKATAPRPAEVKESEESVFERYEPAHIKEGQPHPAPIVETKAMGAVAPPPVTYKHHVPRGVVASGQISGAQLEAVVYNGQAQQTFSVTGHRHGFLIGDGTGTGKTRTLAAIVADNWHQGRKRAVWVTAAKNTAPEIRDALNRVGLEKAALTEAGEFKGGGPIPATEGVLYLTYSSFIRPVKGGKFDGRQRWEQLADWLGEDGVLIFDESHAMKSATTDGLKKPSKTALAGIDIQEKNPKLRVTYASATGATDVANLAYMTRLGLWGKGTAFPGGFGGFLQQVGTAGVGAMEIVAQNLKSLGKYTARNISYEGVEYEEVTHTLTPEQRTMYATAATAWRTIFDGFDAGWQTVTADEKGKARFARQQLYGNQQRFFKLLISAMKMPTTIKTIEDRLARGMSVVVSLTNTNEEPEKRLATKAAAEGLDLDELDFSPRELLANLVERNFPVQNMTEVEDENGNIQKKPVWNADGSPEINPAAVRLKEALLAKLGGIYLPENPLDQIRFHFGDDAVAELSGRSNRRVKNENTGKMERVPRKATDGSSKNVNLTEMAWFQDGRKRIAIITPAADTGISLHASLEAKNQQRRAHILHELSWSADRMMQGNGRTHRTNQASAPVYILMSSDVGGEKRFAASGARKLASLGALTRGHRDASGAGAIAKYNFETEYGKAAVESVLEEVAAGRLKDDALGNIEKLLTDMGILKPDRPVTEFNVPDVRQFFNRILALDLDRQGALFNLFMDRFGQVIASAKEQGTFDEGVEDLKGQNIRVAGEPAIVWEDKGSGAKTEYRTFQYEQPVARNTWAVLRATLDAANAKGWGWARNKKSGALVAVRPWASRTETWSGRQIERVYVERPRAASSGAMETAEFNEKYERLTDADQGAMRKEWERQVAEVPEFSTHELHMFSGVVLPIWDRVVSGGGQALKVNRIVTKDGERYVGVVIPQARIRTVLKGLGVGVKPVDPSEAWGRVMGEGDDLKLAGGFTLKRRQWQGSQVIEIAYQNMGAADKLRALGISPIQDSSWKWRYFLPTDEARGKAILGKLLEEFPSIEGEDVGRKGGQAGGKWQQQEQAQHRAGSPPQPPARPGGPPAVPDDNAPRKSGKPGQFESEALRDWAKENRRPPAPPEKTENQVAAWLRDTSHMFTRVYRELGPAEHPYLQTLLRRLTRHGDAIGYARAQMDIARVVAGLSDDERAFFNDLILIRDLHEDIQKRVEDGEEDIPTPRGVPIEQIAREHRLLHEDLKRSPKVAEALAKHKALTKRVTERYLAAAEAALGRAPEFWREDHYRRLMVDEARKMYEERTRGLKAPTGRGFLKTRTGRLTEYNTDYVQAQFNHLSRMVRDTLHYELLAEVRKLDITRELYREAMRANDAAMIGKLGSLLADLQKFEQMGGQVKFRADDRFKRLATLAAADALPDDGQWGDVLEALSLEGQPGGSGLPKAPLTLATWQRIGEYLKWLLDEKTPAADVALQAVRASVQKQKKTLGDQFVSPADIVPEGIKAWRLSDSPLFEPIWREPDAMVDAAVDALAKEADIPTAERRSPVLLLPENVADLLIRVGKPKADDALAQWVSITQRPRRFWTWATMFGPTRFLGGAVRDLAGNIDATIALNPHALTKLKEAATDVRDLLQHKIAPEPDSPLYEAVEMGLFSTLFANIEDGGVLKGLDLLGEAIKRDEGGVGAKALVTYMKLSQLPREIPEAIMRYAQILSFAEQIKDSPEGLPATFAASRPEVIQQLPEKERAYRLAQDTMVNYDQQNEVVDVARALANPFARFAAGNMARYWRAFGNAFADPRLMRRLGMRIGGRALTAGAAIYLGKLAVKTLAFGAMLEAWNRWRFGDEEDRLPPHIRAKPHLILGNHPVTGELMVLTNLSVLPSAVAWFGAEDSRGHVDDILNGRKTLQEIGREMAKDAGRTVMGLAVAPEAQGALEGIAGQRLFPDPFDPRPIRGGAQGRVLHVFESLIPFPVKDVRVLAAGTPEERSRQAHALASMGAQPFDLGKAQYDEVRGRIIQWKDAHHKGQPSAGSNARGEALYAIRAGARFMDVARVRQAIRSYEQSNGTLDGLYEAVATLDPFHNLDRKEVRAIIGPMNTGDRQRVKEAVAWYGTAFAPHGRVPLDSKVTLKLGTEFTDADNDAQLIPLDSYIRSTARMVEREWAKTVRRTLREMPTEKRELRRNERGR